MINRSVFTVALIAGLFVLATSAQAGWVSWGGQQLVGYSMFDDSPVKGVVNFGVWAKGPGLPPFSVTYFSGYGGGPPTLSSVGTTYPYVYLYQLVNWGGGSDIDRLVLSPFGLFSVAGFVSGRVFAEVVGSTVLPLNPYVEDPYYGRNYTWGHPDILSDNDYSLFSGVAQFKRITEYPMTNPSGFTYSGGTATFAFATPPLTENRTSPLMFVASSYNPRIVEAKAYSGANIGDTGDGAPQWVPVPTPEPSSLILVLSALAPAAWALRQRRKIQS